MLSERDRFLKAAALFEQCADLEGEARAAFVAEQCGDDEALRRDLESLLAHDAGEGTTAEVGLRGMIDSAISEGYEPDELPETIGVFRVIREIGRGGMGVVYEAEQPEPKRRVAVKTISGVVSRELTSRMRQEAQALALIEHRGVARIYEAGVATVFGQRTPYIAME